MAVIFRSKQSVDSKEITYLRAVRFYMKLDSPSILRCFNQQALAQVCPNTGSSGLFGFVMGCSDRVGDCSGVFGFVRDLRVYSGVAPRLFRLVPDF